MECSEILGRFALPGTVRGCVPYGEGHVNQTFLAETDGGRFILQRISDRAFGDIPGLMENMAAVTAHLRRKDPDPRHSLRLVPTREGENCWRDREGAFWRCSVFVEGGRAPHSPASAPELREAGRAWGRFLWQLGDLPAGSLRETIPHFHDTPAHFRLFREVLQEDPMGKAGELGPEIDFLLEREAPAGELRRRREAGELPLRLTHNDTKLDNLLLDARTGEALCVLDLDTVMPGLSAYDFGDAVRSGAVTGERDRLELALLSAFAEGFREGFPALTAPERESLALGAWTMTVECALRYLTDYLDGGAYFAAPWPGNRLERARSQIRLARDMELRRGEMERAIG